MNSTSTVVPKHQVQSEKRTLINNKTLRHILKIIKFITIIATAPIWISIALFFVPPLFVLVTVIEGAIFLSKELWNSLS